MYSSERSSGLDAPGILDFQDDLILVFRFLDQIEIILRIGVAQQASGCASPKRHTCAAWSRRISISRFGVLLKKSEETVAKPGILPQPSHEFLRHVVHLLRIHAGQRVGILSLVLICRAGADVRAPAWAARTRNTPGMAPSLPIKPPATCLNGRAHLAAA